MKTIQLWVLTCLFLAAGLFSCSNNGGDASPVSDGCTITWKLNGASDDATPNVCVLLDNTFNLGLIGSDGIQIQIDNLTGTGTFSLGTDDAIVLTKDGNDNTLGALNGSIIVTKFSNNRIEGTFSGTFFDITDINMTDSFEVSDGEFVAVF